jgi:CO dehydrogenase maturation factor
VRDELTPRDLWAIETMARQAEVLAATMAVATAAGDPTEACRLWLAVGRQASSYQRYLDPWDRAVAFDRVRSDITGHHDLLLEHQRHAREEVGAADERVKQQASAGLGVRLAVVGKGGVGKTVLASTIARLLARRGRKVLAVDLDTNPGMAFSLGIPVGEAGLPLDVLEEHPGANYGWQLAKGVTPGSVVERCSVVGPDGVRFLGVGKISSPAKEAAKRSVPALVQVLLGFGWPDWDVVADLEAGPTTPFERYHAFAHDTLVVVGPSWRSAMTARRLMPMVAGQQPLVVGNHFRHEPNHPGLSLAARIPDDPEVAEAERRGLAPIDACPGTPAMEAITELTELILAGRGAHCF